MKLKKEVVFKNLKDSIENKTPVEFFANFTDMFNLLFDKLDALEDSLDKANLKASLAIEWDPEIARELFTQQIKILKKEPELFKEEIIALKAAYKNNECVGSYKEFCTFWKNQFGYHPFMDYEK